MPDQRPGSLHGVVKEETTAAFLRRVGVQVGRLTGGLTHDDGTYSIANIPPGVYDATARRNNVEPVTQRVTIGPGEDVSLDFLVTISPTLSGRVLDGNKEKVAGARVWVIASEYQSGILRHYMIGARTTEEDGSFTFDAGLEAGRVYYLLAERPPSEGAGEEKPVAEPTYYGDATSLDTAVPLTLRPAEERGQVDIQLRRHAAYCVDGRIEVDGQPVARGLKIYEPALAGTQIVRAEARSEVPSGAFRVCGLTPGSYRLLTSEPPNLTGSADVFIADSDVHKIQLAIDRASLRLELAWEGDPPPEGPELSDAVFLKAGNSWVAASKEGEVLPVALPPRLLNVLKDSESGESMQLQRALLDELLNLTPRNVRLQLSGAGNEAGAGAQIGIPYEGPFNRELGAGDYIVNAAISGSYVKRMTVDSVVSSDRLLHLAGGLTSTLGILFARDGGTIAFTVKDTDGNPVNQAAILVLPADATGAALASATVRSGLSDVTGNYTSETLPPGKYRAVALTRPLRQTPEAMEKLLAALANSPAIDLAPNAAVHTALHPVSLK